MDDASLARRRLRELRATLETAVAEDEEHDVRGMAIPVIDAALSDARDALADDPVAETVRQTLRAALEHEDTPVRAVDLLHVVGQVQAALGPEPPPASSARPSWVQPPPI
jgi:hypothetical protein